jgi:GNAT superfamily N-acetyltransferase
MMIRNEAPAAEVLELFTSAWWTEGRDLDGVEAMLAGSDLVFGLYDGDELAGFARILTDGVYLALVLDVIVAPHHRGRGYGAALMDAIVSHPRVAGVRSVELVCQPDVAAFYERWGFTEKVGRSRLMRRTTDPLLAR